MRVLVSGLSGFIGFAVNHRLLDLGDEVMGLDNYNDYCEVSLKEARGHRPLEHAGYTRIRASVEEGIPRFVDWFRNYYSLQEDALLQI
jgi:UDP-glucuronate 4-epimerase